MKVNASITDFPLHTSLETFFRELKNSGADGVELVIGAKSAWSFGKVKELSKKYNLPVISLHQSPWSGLGLFFEKEFSKAIETLEVNKIVFHPLAFTSFDSSSMKKYFKKLQKLQDRYGVRIMLENVENVSVYKPIFNNINSVTEHLKMLYNIVNDNNFLITYDTSHGRFIKPQEEDVFLKIFPKIGNIHLSSFAPGKEHLALYEGIFDTKGFIEYLYQKKYEGLVTLEINYYLFERFVRPYDFLAIKNSVDIIKSVIDK